MRLFNIAFSDLGSDVSLRLGSASAQDVARSPPRVVVRVLRLL